MPYDVGAITRELQRDFGLFALSPGQQPPNKATPEHLSVLLNGLRDLTSNMTKARATMSDWLPDAGIITWDRSFRNWRLRLGEYEHEVGKAPPGDRQDVLWSVTAPLLLGFFGGPNSRLPQQPIDAVTPFSLANQLEVDETWRNEQWDKLIGDLKQGAAEIVDTVGSNVLPLVGVAFVGYLGYRWWVSR